MSEPDPIDLSNLLNLQFRPSWADDLAKSDAPSGEVIWGKVPGGGRDDDRPRPGGARPGGRGFDRNDRGPRPERRDGPPGQRGPRPDFRGGAPGQGDRRPPPRNDAGGPPRGERRDGPPGQRGPRPERRDFQGQGPGRRDDRGPQGRPPFRGDRRDSRDFRDRDYQETPPLPGWPVKLVPDHRQVEAIARQIKASGRAFSVFDVGRLFMQSRDRFHVRFTRQDGSSGARDGAPKDAAAQGDTPPASAGPRGPEVLLQCAADGSLWVTRDEAIRHILNSPALEKYYRRETVAVDAPKGNWTSVAVCGFSGALLGPPNHHDFQRNVARLHRERFSDMSLERYKSRIRTEKDETLLQKWQESLSTAVQYVPVTEEPLPEGAEPPAPLKSVSEMEAHFLRTHAAAAVTPVTVATVPGNIPGKNLSPGLLNLLRREVENQQRFPMQLVQDLCRDLESQGLRFFKRDRKATFVCRNRPHFLPDDLVLSDRIRAMVEMVRANPGITYSRLVSTLAPHIVRVDPAASGAPRPAPAAEPETSPAALENVAPTAPEAPSPVEAEAAEAPVEAAAPAAETAMAPEAVMAPEVAVPSEPGTAALEPETAAPTEVSEGISEAPGAAEPAAEAPAAAPAPPPAPPAPAQHLSPEEIAILQDLHWLVQEGYVTEFQNGELFVLGRPPQPPAERKPRPQRQPRQGTESIAPRDPGEEPSVEADTGGEIATGPAVAAESEASSEAVAEPAAPACVVNEAPEPAVAASEDPVVSESGATGSELP